MRDIENIGTQRLVFVVLLGIALPGFSNAQGLKVGNPAADGFSPENLHRIDSLLNSFTKDHKIAGVCALVARHGHIDYWNASGYSDIKGNKLLQKQICSA